MLHRTTRGHGALGGRGVCDTPGGTTRYTITPCGDGAEHPTQPYTQVGIHLFMIRGTDGIRTMAGTAAATAAGRTAMAQRVRLV